MGLFEVVKIVRDSFARFGPKQPSLVSQAAPPIATPVPPPTKAPSPAIPLAQALPKITALAANQDLTKIIEQHIASKRLDGRKEIIVSPQEHQTLVTALLAHCQTEPKITNIDGSLVTTADLQELLTSKNVIHLTDEQRLARLITDGRLLTQTGEGRDAAKRQARYTAIYTHYKPIIDPELTPFRDNRNTKAPITISASDFLAIVDKLRPHISDANLGGVSKFTIAILTIKKITIPGVFKPSAN